MSQVNKISIGEPEIIGRTIHFRYVVTGPWSEAFRLNRGFCVEYGIEISGVPAGVAVIPLLANVLPMAWVYNAEVEITVCDADFLRCLSEVKSGYQAMYPMIKFEGVLNVGRVENNSGDQKGAICLFSGGVDPSTP